MNGRTFTIVGSLVSGLAQLDESSVFLSLRSAQDFVELPQAATEIILMAKDQNKVPQLNVEVTMLVREGDPTGQYKVIPWYEANSLVSFMSVAEKIYSLFYILIVLFASFVVINTMLMIVNERTQEIGMLGALGFTGRQIVLLLVLEGASLGLIGSAFGVALGTFITKALSATGIDYSQATQTLGKELLYPSRIYPVFSLGSALYAFFLGIVIPALGCYFPARRAQKLDPSTALRAL
jgi:putative ABC transport system permease protein